MQKALQIANLSSLAHAAADCLDVPPDVVQRFLCRAVAHVLTPCLSVLMICSAARARIDKAEAQGRRRDEQLEMLHAVRQYMAQTKAHAKALQAQC